MDDFIFVGRVIRMLRREKEFSQFDVAYRSDMNLSYFCRLERGEANPSLRKLYDVFRVLEVTAPHFFELVQLEKQYFLVHQPCEPQAEIEYVSEDSNALKEETQNGSLLSEQCEPSVSEKIT